MPVPATPPDLTVTGEVVEWRGPAPFHFLVLPPADADWLHAVVREITYGWGMVPVTGRIGGTSFTTSLWPRHGSFVVPLKDAVRAAEDVGLGDVVTAEVWLRWDS
ncbi:DUF1905 domain-containing protein [Ornithinimicrobium sp. W1665]|uniref:DUF1905 domain-containing protein n=1 Tax=unclassified Ornithinimicrobium TaxID=2615080 RepID=UPI003CF474AB